MRTGWIPRGSAKSGYWRHYSEKLCRVGGVLAFALATAGCVQSANLDALAFRIAVTSDEPQATIAGRDILAQGGNAVDAAVAMAMTMAVTLPSRVGLGGGGACLVHDRTTGTVRALEFLPERQPGADAASPLFLRGLFALHAEYGRLRWESLVIGAETAARFGAPVSRAFDRDIAVAVTLLGEDAEAVRLLSRGDGLPIREGDTFEQLDLAAVLSQVRLGGVGTFYSGQLARTYAESATAIGLPLDAAAVRAAQPAWVDPIAVGTGNDMLYFLADSGAAGARQALIWAVLSELYDYDDLAPDERAHLLVEAQWRAAAAPPGLRFDQVGARRLMDGYDPQRRAAPSGGAAVGGFAATLAALSFDGTAVVCGFTLNGLFGSGRVAPGTGIFVARAPTQAALAIGGLAMLVNEPKAQFLYAGAADLVPALAVPLAELLRREQTVDDALAAPRAAPGLFADEALRQRTYVEESAGPAVLDGLRRRGHEVETVPSLGRGSAIYCLWDRASTTVCRAAADPRGAGLAYTLER